mgnify:CR=1 FL=1
MCDESGNGEISLPEALKCIDEHAPKEERKEATNQEEDAKKRTKEPDQDEVKG